MFGKYGKSQVKTKVTAHTADHPTNLGYYHHPSDSDYTVKVSTTDHTEIPATLPIRTPTDTNTVVITMDIPGRSWLVRTQYSTHSFNDFMEMAAFIADYYNWEDNSAES